MLRSLARIIAWAGPYRRDLYLGSLLSFLMTWAGAVPLLTAAWMLARVAQDNAGGPALDASSVWISLGIIALAILARFVLSYWKNRLQESIRYKVAAQQRIRIGAILKRVPLGYFSTMKTGDVLATATTELGTLELQGMKMIDAVLNGYLALGALVVFLLAIDPLAGLVACLGTGLSGLALWGINRRSTRLSPATHAVSEDLSREIVGLVRGLATAKSYGRGGAALEPIRAASARSRRDHIAVELGFTPLNVAHLIALRLTSVALVGLAAWSFLEGRQPLWSFLCVAMFSFTMFSAVERINDSAHMLGVLNDILERLDRIENATFIDEEGRDIEPDGFDISLTDVCFSYGRENVLHDVTMRIPEGSTCAIVGPSGAGKTTIVSLIARFHDVTSGRIVIGGHDVREFTCDALLRNFSMVFQNVYLFHDTIAANIAFGRPGATRDDIERAARQACCHEFISELPDGYDTVIGEGGATLSGGQRQRLSIARALLKDAPIIILDEATASVDPGNEQLIQRALRELTAGKTVIVIAHRLATVEAADQIVVVNDGRVEQRGTHAQLMESDGTYRRFVRIRAQAEGWRIGAPVAAVAPEST